MDIKNLDKEVNIEVVEKKQIKKHQQTQKQEEIEENKKIYSFTLKPSLVKKLDNVAKIKDRTRSNMLEKILEEYFEKKGI